MIKNILNILLYFILLPVLIYLYFSTSEEVEKIGVVTNFGSKVSDTGIHPYLVIRVDDHTLTIPRHSSSRFDIGKKVIMMEKKTKLFDMKRYTFKKFQDKMK